MLPDAGSGLLCPIPIIDASHPPVLLVVDDDAPVRHLLVRQLEQRGYATRQASSGIEALELIGQHQFDVVLLDVGMPSMNGYQVLQRIRVERSAGVLPVIMVTGRCRSDDVVEALALGANDYVIKPIDLPVTLARIETQLQRRRVESQVREREARYAAAIAGATDGIWDWTLATNELFVSEGWKLRFGWGHGESPTAESWFGRLLEEDRARVRGEVDAHIAGLSRQLRVEYRMRDASNVYRWVQTRGLAVRDSAGRALRLAGSFTDITESKESDPIASLSTVRAPRKSHAGIPQGDTENRMVMRQHAEIELRPALERGEFRLHYQPILRLDRESVVGFEALLRWAHPVRGLLRPQEFVSLAEDADLLVPVGRWVLRKACRQLAAWHSEGLGGGGLRMSVNLSAKEFQQADMAGFVAGLLAEYGVNGRQLEIEITEQTAMSNEALSVARLSQLKASGVSVCLDAFGAGHSSFAYLHRFPVDRLKIDRSFVARLCDAGDGAGRPIVRAVLAMARDMGIEVVAEGVEGIEQFDLLCGLSCQLGQGYLFSKPVDADTATGILRSGLRSAGWQMGQRSLLRGGPDSAAKK